MLSFYADESGSMGRGQGDWVALIAIGFHDDNWKLLKDSVNALKRRYFQHWNLDELVNTKHDEIIAQHRTLLQEGTPRQAVDRIIEQPFFMESDSSVHVQLADVLAYNVVRQARDGFEKPYPLYQRILPKCRGYSTWHKGPAPYGLKVEP